MCRNSTGLEAVSKRLGTVWFCFKRCPNRCCPSVHLLRKPKKSIPTTVKTLRWHHPTSRIANRAWGFQVAVAQSGVTLSLPVRTYLTLPTSCPSRHRTKSVSNNGKSTTGALLNHELGNSGMKIPIPPPYGICPHVFCSRDRDF